MPGMNSGLSPASPILVAAFRSALLHQTLIIALIIALVLIAWGASRTATGEQHAAPAWREPRARMVLRIGFGVLWLLDGLLQAQPQMAGGMPSQTPVDCGRLAVLGGGHGELGREHLELPPHRSRRIVGLDPGRHRALDDLRGARLVAPARRAVERGLGADRLGVRRVVRRDLCPRAYRALRRARCRAPLRRGRRAAAASRAHLAAAADRPARPRRERSLLPRHGAAAGLAGARLLAGQAGWPAWLADVDDPVDGEHPAAALA